VAKGLSALMFDPGGVPTRNLGGRAKAPEDLGSAAPTCKAAAAPLAVLTLLKLQGGGSPWWR